MRALSTPLLLTALQLVTAQPSLGPYTAAQRRYDVAALDSTNPSAWVWYPIAESYENGTAPKFPLISYLHGMLGGNFDILGYSALFQQIASYGFVVTATLSCSTGCEDESQGAPWTNCQGILPLRPHGKGWGPYYGEALKMIDWAKNMSAAGGDEIFDMINWDVGVGIAGYSMGGQGTSVAACPDCAQKWDIRAAALHHPAEGMTKDGNIGVNISVPTIAFTSSGDSIWPETEAIMNANPKTPAAYRNEVGWSHEEPNGRPDVGLGWENPRLATFTAAWFQVFLNGDEGEYYDLIFSNDDASLCNYAEMVDCHVDI